MKIIQILDELSNKNISLVSVAKIISNYDFLSKKSKIITSKNKTNFENIKIFKNNIKNFLFFSPVYYFLYKHKPDIIHIHGLWRPIHLLFILKSLVLNIPVIIQPHGMLLDQALRSKSRINYIFKVIILRLYRLLLHKKVSFIAVTLEEKKSITKFFLNSKILELLLFY